MKHFIAPIIFAMAILICRAVDLTNNLSSDNGIIYNPPIVWGGVTNFVRGALSDGQPLVTSVRVGIQVEDGMITLSGQPLKVLSPAFLGLEDLARPPVGGYPKLKDGYPNSHEIPPNDVISIFQPPTNEKLLLFMTDSNGVPVPKTREGLSFGRPLSLKPNTSWDELRDTRIGLFPVTGINTIRITDLSKSFNEEEYMESTELNPSKYFKIKNIGLYKLTVTLRLYVEDTNTYLKAITLPPVTVDVRVEKN